MQPDPTDRPRVIVAPQDRRFARASAKFYTALVLVAVITSQFAGAWLEYVLHRGWPLLSMDKMESQIAARGDDTIAA